MLPGGGATIEAMPAATARRIGSMQVVTCLASVVKELVENSLDAGSATVEVLLVDGGAESVVVVDDGCGITLGGEEVPLLSQRASSKQTGLANGGNTVSVGAHDTLGFRGEALHSLAMLADVVIETRPRGEEETLQITYDRELGKSVMCPCAPRGRPGTTVTVRRLFAGIPVRRREFLANSKKQLSATVSLIKSWAVMRPGVRFFAESRASDPPQRQTLCSTKGDGDMLAAIGDVFGGKVAAGLVSVNWRCDEEGASAIGLVSKVGCGRVTRDMQILALDGRLVENRRWTQAITDAFSECHPHTAPNRCPALFLNIVMTPPTLAHGAASYDVNVAPDKKSVVTKNETQLVTALYVAAKEEFTRLGNVHAIGRQTPAELTARQRNLDLVLTPIAASVHTPIRYRNSRKSSAPGESGTPRRDPWAGPTAESESSHSTCTSSAGCTAGSEPSVTVVDEGCTCCHTVLSGKLPPIDSAPRGIRFSWQLSDSISKEHHHVMEPDSLPSKRQRKAPPGRRQFSGLQSAKCEEELSAAFSKASFCEMRVVGQFNKGFIVSIHDGDIFVVDQHAADEKFNYERLVAGFEPRPQTLIAPVRVEMEHEERIAALAHKDALRMHGFVVAEDQDSSSCVLVRAVPLLPYDTVRAGDVRELTAQLLQHGFIVRRLKAVWHSMATKACRTSIMIGTTLTDAVQSRVVTNMGTMDHPWNCPHGRPTMRHVGLVPPPPAARSRPRLAELL